MNFKELYTMALDKLGLKDGDRKTEHILKNGINYAYLEIAEKDHSVVEFEYTLDPTSSIVYLPDNFLSMLRIEHSIEGVLEDSEYKIKNNMLILGTHIPLTGELTLVMSQTPDILTKDTDVPEINPKYHPALLYYAMFLYSDNPYYYNMYKVLTADLNIDTEKDFINNSTGGEAVTDVYFTPVTKEV